MKQLSAAAVRKQKVRRIANIHFTPSRIFRTTVFYQKMYFIGKKDPADIDQGIRK